MDKHYSGSDSDSSGEYVYDNPFLLEDDKFEREFEKTLALFDALLIGEDSLSDTFSLSSSPTSTLRFDAKKSETKPHSYFNDGHNKPTSIQPKKNIHIETSAVLPEERPKSFLHDEVSEFNRLLKELSETPLTSKLQGRSSSTLRRRPGTKSRNSVHHHHSFSASLPHQKLLDRDDPTNSEPDDLLSDDETTFQTAEEKLLLGGTRPCNCENATSSRDHGNESSDGLHRLTSCPNCVKRQSLRRMIESGFFESLRSLPFSHGSCDALSPRRHSDEDQGDLGPTGRSSSLGPFRCLPLRFRSLDHGLDGKKDESDSAYQTGSTDTLISTPGSSLSLVPGTVDVGDSPLDPTPTEGLGLEEKLEIFNRNKSGLYVKMAEGNKNIYHGTIRVHLNLIQPISMRLGPASSSHASFLAEVRAGDGEFDDDYDHNHLRDGTGSVTLSSADSIRKNEMASSSSSSLATTTTTSSVHHSLPELSNRYASFYVPPDVTKVIHVTSEWTTPTVIRTLLNKYQIVNSAKRFALFQRTYDKPVSTNQEDKGSKGSDLHLARPLTCHMRKLRDDERPLEILLMAVEEAGVVALETIHFVLQEYSSGEIIWEAFSVPELNNFLAILSREEQLKITEVEHRYLDAKAAIESKIRDLELQSCLQ